METNKFNGTNYNDWLRNLRIVLDFENQGYVLDKPLPVTLPEGSSPEERLTFEKWYEDNRKVRSIILASMTNEIQKQYDRLEDVPSIMLRMKDVYAVPDRHIRYAATKAFFRTKMTEGSSVHSHGVKMLSLVEKLEDLKAGLNNDTYIDMILQSLPPSYDPFIVNYNMNGLEKSIHELINMLVQYEATTHKSEPAVLVGEASTFKAKDKGARRWKKKRGKGTTVTATASTGGAPPAAPKGKGKGKVGVLSGQRQMMSACIAKERGIGRGSVHNSSPTQVLQRSRKLSNDKMILRLGDGKAVVAEAVGSLRLVVSSHIRIDLKDVYFVPSSSDIRKKLRDITSMIRPSKKIFVSRNAVFLEKGFPSDSRHDEVLIEESNEEPHRDTTTSFEPTVHTNSVPVLRRSTRESRVPDRYGFVGLTSQLDNDPKTYGEAMSDIDSDKWLEAMKFEMDSMGSNQALAKGYTQRHGVYFEETYSPVAMAKSIRILLAIAAWYDYEIWQMDVKTAFLNDFVEEEIFMDQPEGFTAVGEEQKVCHLQRSIYGLKQASRSWNTRFDEVIRGYDFIKNDYDPCVYKKISGISVAYLVLYVDDILLIGNDVKMLGDIKAWLSTQFSMKDMGEASYILGIKIYKDRSRRLFRAYPILVY
ncbi:UNVERIFIED_CONTAM: Retrovirus-related Pol polyprotein from transposon RE2 [Sesamum radiatum]|uniref:Retrovirus-related Pol polyprotein from transposon RE2 n=1 Tax=Sesamum radiatum TaxID=300843 RepID=A0AAW2W129_SESRA